MLLATDSLFSPSSWLMIFESFKRNKLLQTICKSFIKILQYNWFTRPQMESFWSLSYVTVCLSHTVGSVCVCHPGFQGTGNSSHCHHLPHRFLLLFQLCESWHTCDAGAWLIWLPPWGNTSHVHELFLSITLSSVLRIYPCQLFSFL